MKYIHEWYTNKKTEVLLLEAYTPEKIKHDTDEPSTTDLSMNAEILKKELNGLQFSLLYKRERNVIEGSHHTTDGGK